MIGLASWLEQGRSGFAFLRVCAKWAKRRKGLISTTRRLFLRHGTRNKVCEKERQSSISRRTELATLACELPTLVALRREVPMPQDSAGGTKTFVASPAFVATVPAFDCVKRILGSLTFDLSGGPKARPLEGRVSHLCVRWGCVAFCPRTSVRQELPPRHPGRP